MSDSRSRIMGASTPGYSFLQVGQSVTGQILTEPKDVQQRNFHDGTPAFWPSGDAKMQTVFQIRTALRNYEGISQPDRSQPDDGVRSIFIKGKHMERAAKDAVLAAQASWLEIGGWIEITYTGDDMSSKAASKPKFFSIRYQAPPPGSVPAQQHQQQAAPAHSGYGQQQGYAQPGAQGAPGWQQPGWNPQQPVQPVANGFGGPGAHAGPPMPPQPSWGQYQARQDVGDPYATPVQSAVPSHHGSPDQMPSWAQASAPPAPSSAPPAPQLSTLELIAQQQSGMAESGQIEPAF